MKLLTTVFVIGSMNFLYAAEKNPNINMGKVEKVYESFLAQEQVDKKTERRVLHSISRGGEIEALTTFSVDTPQYESALAAFYHTRSLLSKEEQLVLDQKTKDYREIKR